MKLVVPNAIDLVSSSVPENEYAAWSASTAYSAGDRCIYEHYIYECVTAHMGKKPDENSNSISGVWRLVGATNRWAMFDDVVSTQTVAPSGADALVVTVAFDYADCVGLMNINGEKVKFEVFDAGEAEPYYTREFNLVQETTNFRDFFYSPIERVSDITYTFSDVANTDIPIGVPGSTIRVTLTLAGGGASVGHMVVGLARAVGQTKIDATAGTKTYSKRIEDEYGNVTIIPRRVVKKVSCMVYVDAAYSDIIAKLMSKIDIKPALFLADNRDTFEGGYEMLVIYGTKTDHEFSISPEGPNVDMLSISIEGVA